MIDFKNKVYIGSDKRESVFDCTIPAGAKAVVIFVHGYKGFKDWGAWQLMHAALVQNDFGFVKFNMSHNGGTISNPIDFPDLDAFGKNCYSFELNDLDVIITEVDRLIKQELELNIPIYLLGHSRGGGVVILKSATDSRVSKVISLAGISDIGSRFPDKEELEQWKSEGVRYVENGRTKQQMPHYYSFYEDFIQHQRELNIEQAARSLKIPFLQIHSDMDEAVSISEGLQICLWTETEIEIIKGSNHTFGISHPWQKSEVSEDFKEAIDAALSFFSTQPS